MATQTKKTSRVDDPYFDLVVNVFPLRPIRSREQHQLALKTVQRLIGDKRQSVRDYKMVLVSLIVNYEREMGWQADLSSVTPARMIRHLIGEQNMSVNAFAKSVGIAQSALSDMLSGKRSWSKSAIAKLSKRFALNPGLFFK